MPFMVSNCRDRANVTFLFLKIKYNDLFRFHSDRTSPVGSVIIFVLPTL